MTEKVFKTVEEQIQILKSRKLNILDEKNAKRVLQKISYYDIVNGYNDIFLEVEADASNGIEEEYCQDTNFEMIYELYLFDADLRTLILKYTDIIETYLSSSLAYVISSNHGHKESNYIDKSIYKPGKRKSSTKFEVDGLIERMKSCLNKDMAPIVYYKHRHGYLPPWILFKYLMFGEKEKVFQLLKPKDKNEVVKIFQSNFIISKSFSANFYTQALAIIREYRNTCAHGSRVYNHVHKYEDLPYNHLLEFLNFDKAQGLGKNDITALITSIYSFTGGDRTIDSNWVSFITEFDEALMRFKNKVPVKFYDKLVDEMKLPTEFEKLKHI